MTVSADITTPTSSFHNLFRIFIACLLISLSQDVSLSLRRANDHVKIDKIGFIVNMRVALIMRIITIRTAAILA
jgi:hypothetical protein